MHLLGVGASAISTAIGQMRKYRTAKIYQILTSSYVGELEPGELKRLEENAGIVARQLDKGWELPALQILSDHGWSIPGQPDAIRHIHPLMPSDNSRNLAQIIRDCSPDFPEVLANHFIALDQTFASAFERGAQERLLAITTAINVVMETGAISSKDQDADSTSNERIDAYPGSGRPQSRAEIGRTIVDALQTAQEEAELVRETHPLPRLARAIAWLEALIRRNPAKMGLTIDFEH